VCDGADGFGNDHDGRDVHDAMNDVARVGRARAAAMKVDGLLAAGNERILERDPVVLAVSVSFSAPVTPKAPSATPPSYC